MSLTHRAYTIAGFCEAFGVGRSKIYLELKAGKLRAKKLGKKTLITEDEARRWLMALPEAALSAPSMRLSARQGD